MRRLVPLAALALAAAGAAAAQEIDMDVVFRCGATDADGQAKCLEAREIILNNCTICHTFVPIVMQQWTEPEWQGLLDRHVGNGRVDQLSAEQVQTIHDYLAANFNETSEPPDLPPELLETWTNY